MIKDVSDLEVYQESLKLLPLLYKFVDILPKSEYDLVFQIVRAARSIAPNIAEGFAKRYSEKEFRRFLKIALASCDEVITHLRIIAITYPNLTEKARVLAERYKILSKRINTLCSNWRSGGTF